MPVVAKTHAVGRGGIEKVKAHLVFGAITEEDGALGVWIVKPTGRLKLVAGVELDGHFIEELSFK